MNKRQTARLMAWALVLAMPMYFGACKKDGGDSVTPNSIEGTYVITGLTINPGIDPLGTGQKTTDLLSFFRSLPNGLGNDAVTCITTSTITFNSNGKVTSKAGQKCDASAVDPADNVPDNSTWKLEGSKLTLTSSTGAEVYDVVRNGNVMSLSQTGTEDYGEGSKQYTTTLQLTKQ